VHANRPVDRPGKDPEATRSSLVRRLHDWSDDAGWQRFFDTYWKLIYAIALRAGLADVEAQDVVQETFLSLAKCMRAGGYDRSKSSFKTFLYTLARRRIIDHLRRRRQPMIAAADSSHAEGDELLNELPDPVSLSDLAAIWESEWQKNLLDAALERVRKKVTPKQFQIFDLAVVRAIPVLEVTQLLKVNAAQVYLAKHRVGSLVRKEAERLRANPEEPQ
jgi:RNA polymerase sigma factor (sigma-70 family)